MIDEASNSLSPSISSTCLSNSSISAGTIDRPICIVIHTVNSINPEKRTRHFDNDSSELALRRLPSQVLTNEAVYRKTRRHESPSNQAAALVSSSPMRMTPI
jgi:hypothetical protein